MDDEKALLFIREEIDAIDSEIIALLESRLNLSLQIGKVKKNLDKNMHDDSRAVSYTHLTLPTKG